MSTSDSTVFFRTIKFYNILKIRKQTKVFNYLVLHSLADIDIRIFTFIRDHP